MAQLQQDQNDSTSSTNELEETTDNFTSMVQQVVSQVCSSSSVRSVFGEPVTRDDVTVIPVAGIIAGFGAGAGAGKKKERRADSGNGAGMGVGGGFIMQPWGVCEISKNEVRFRRARHPGLLRTLFDAATSLLRRP
jgi:uncharacterized spore protein YtfJ